MTTRACRLAPAPVICHAAVNPDPRDPLPLAIAAEHLGEVELAVFRIESRTEAAIAYDLVFRWPVYIILVMPPAVLASERMPNESTIIDTRPSTIVYPPAEDENTSELQSHSFISY